MRGLLYIITCFWLNTQLCPLKLLVIHKLGGIQLDYDSVDPIQHNCWFTSSILSISGDIV